MRRAGAACLTVRGFLVPPWPAGPVPSALPSPLSPHTLLIQPTHRLSLQVHFCHRTFAPALRITPSPRVPPEPHYFPWVSVLCHLLRGASMLQPLRSSPCPCPCSLFGFSSMQFLPPALWPVLICLLWAPPKARHCHPALTVSQQHHDGLRKGPPLGGGLPQPTVRRLRGTTTVGVPGIQHLLVSWSLSVGSPVTDPGSLSPVQLTLETSVTSHALCARGCGLLDSCGSCLTASLDIPVGEPWQAPPCVPKLGASPSPTLHHRLCGGCSHEPGHGFYFCRLAYGLFIYVFTLAVLGLCCCSGFL